MMAWFRGLLVLGVLGSGMARVVANDGITPTISVEGTAEIRVAPDEVLLTVAVETRAVKLNDAKTENDQRFRAALDFLRSQRLPEEHLQTDIITMSPQYDYEESRTEPVAFTVKRQLGVRLTELDKFENVFEGLISNGVNIVEGIEFRTSNLRKHRDEARRMAIRAAREKAELLAEEMGAKLSGIQSIQENTWGGIFSYGGNRGMMQNAVQDIGGGESGGSLAAGQLQISAQVNAVFTMAETGFDQ